MEKKKSKEDILFEKEMKIVEKGGRIPDYEELDFSKSGNPKPQKMPDKKTPKKK